MSGSSVRAGEAFVEVTTKDKSAAGLQSALAKLKVFALGVKSFSVDFLKDMGGVLAKIGGALAAGGGAITAIMGKAVSSFAETAKFAKQIGENIGAIDAAKAEKLNEAWGTLKATFGAIQFFVGSALAGPLTKLLDVAVELGVKFATWVKDNQELVVIVAAVGIAALAAGTAIAGLGGAFILAAGAITAVVAGITALFTPVGAAIGLVFGLSAAVFVAAGALLLLNPVAQEAMGGIVAAIANGNVVAAFALLANSIRAIWDGAMIGIEQALVTSLTFMLGKIEDVLHKVATLTSVVGISVGGAAGRHLTGVAGSLHQGGFLIGGLNSIIGAGLRQDSKDHAADFAGAIAALIGGSDAEKKKFFAQFDFSGIEAFNHQVAGDKGLGSQAGTFSGSAAGLLGIGPGGGQKVSDDEAHKLQKDTIDAIKRIKAGVVFE